MFVDVFCENVGKAKFEGTLSETHEKDENCSTGWNGENLSGCPQSFAVCFYSVFRRSFDKINAF
jgi:hypothetical protein